ncbi:MAG: hypothetical protein JOY93_05780 [Acidobacteriales bacterium]|nr:hypothetical protein [Terriglobales bacterium]
MPRMIDLVRASAVPATLMQTAARGALAVPAGEMIEILVYLATQSKLFGEQASLTLAGWDETLSKTAAADHRTSQEVLEYWTSPQNFRPALLPALLENPSVREDSLAALAAALPRELVETMLKSDRVSRSQAILSSLSSNPNLNGIQSALIEEKLLPFHPVPGPTSEDARPDVASLADGHAEDDGSTAELAAYLDVHAAEILAEADKPFQPIGGMEDALHVEDLAPQSNGQDPVAVATVPTKNWVKKSSLTYEEQRGSALQKISRLDVKGRIQLAMKGSKEERSILIRDGTKVVALAVLDSPKISDGEVEKFAAQRNVSEAVLRGIPMKRRFMKNYGVVRNLVSNPRTPIDVSLALMKNILVGDLKHLSGNKDVPDTIRKLALKMFKQKLDPSKKSTE